MQPAQKPRQVVYHLYKLVEAAGALTDMCRLLSHLRSGTTSRAHLTPRFTRSVRCRQATYWKDAAISAFTCVGAMHMRLQIGKVC